MSYPQGIFETLDYLTKRVNRLCCAVQNSGGGNFVPYIGATGPVDLGPYDLTVNGVTVGKGNNSLTYNTAVGELALDSITTGDYNLAFGYQSQRDTGGGSNNVSFGFNSLALNTGGSGNAAFGTNALRDNTLGGSYNTAIGINAAMGNTSGNNNLAIGNETLINNQTGSFNIAFGYRAGRYYGGGALNLTNITNSILIGANTGPLANTQTNQIVIGYGTVGLGSNTTILGNASTITTAIYGNLLLGTTTDVGSSILTLSSTSKGFLPPRMTATQASAISTPAEGLLLYVTDTNGTFLAKGWWGWSGAAWQKLNN
jgi:hypothetical protein